MFKFLKNGIEEFKTFAIRGSVIDMAVGIIIGAAFGKVVDSMVKDIIMPPLGWLMGKADFSNLYLTLPTNGSLSHYQSLEAAKAAGAVTINYGLFINSLITFILVAFTVFLLVKAINKLRTAAVRKDIEQEIATEKICPRCFTSIDIRATKCPNCTVDLQ